jgi:hypothetical protein
VLFVALIPFVHLTNQEGNVIMSSTALGTDDAFSTPEGATIPIVEMAKVFLATPDDQKIIPAKVKPPPPRISVETVLCGDMTDHYGVWGPKYYGCGIFQTKAAHDFLAKYACKDAIWGQKDSSTGNCSSIDVQPVTTMKL